MGRSLEGLDKKTYKWQELMIFACSTKRRRQTFSASSCYLSNFTMSECRSWQDRPQRSHITHAVPSTTYLLRYIMLSVSIHSFLCTFSVLKASTTKSHSRASILMCEPTQHNTNQSHLVIISYDHLSIFFRPLFIIYIHNLQPRSMEIVKDMTKLVL